jgi:hypothetical protein
MKRLLMIAALTAGLWAAAFCAPDLINIKISPNPFSPFRGPAYISYDFKSSVAWSAETTIRIYNMSGELIKVIADKAPRTAGVTNVDAWDGKDKNGHWAANGRYILQIELRDVSGTKQYLYSIALVK